MSEQAWTDPGSNPLTGHDEVDAVLADVDSLAGRPLGDHVAGFESAHERLRRALDVTDRTG